MKACIIYMQLKVHSLPMHLKLIEDHKMETKRKQKEMNGLQPLHQAQVLLNSTQLYSTILTLYISQASEAASFLFPSIIGTRYS